jgi:hypothetical protein
METSVDSYVVTASRMLATLQHRSNAYGERGVKEQGFQPDRTWWERIFAVVDAGDATAVCEGEVMYTRHDGTVVSFPFVNVFDLRGELIAAYRIYIDLSLLFSGPA